MGKEASQSYSKFAVRVESVSDENILVLPDGTTTSVPISPGLLVVADVDNAIFEAGAAAGLTAILFT